MYSRDLLDKYKDTSYDDTSNYKSQKSGILDKLQRLMKIAKPSVKYTQEEELYIEKLDEEKRKEINLLEIKISEYNQNNVPLRFKVLEKDLELNVKAKVIKRIEEMQSSPFNSGDNKYNNWVSGLLKVPFGNFIKLPIKIDDGIKKINNYLNKVKTTLDEAVYGHEKTKIQIIQLIAQWISNPESGGNVIGIQGPMGIGKTTLVKEGISKAIERPFEFITLGGANDSSFLEGHSYTFEGSMWGKMADTLIRLGCMNPVFYFDELDKVSKTARGDEIIHSLIHLTDSTQNTDFQDKYFSGIDFDLSKSVFIFSYNDESKINPILLDRMVTIKVDGYKEEEKLKIAKDFLIPKTYKKLNLDKKVIDISDETIKYIIKNYTEEEGVRGLNKCIDSIFSKLNVFLITNDENILPYEIKSLEKPIKVNNKIVETILDDSQNKDSPSIEHMFM